MLPISFVLATIAATAISPIRTHLAGGVEATEIPVRVSAAWLASHRTDADLVILHVGQQRTAYDSAHIPTARFLAYRAYAGPRNGLTTELPPLDSLAASLARLGISNASRIVVYGPAIISHRLFVTLDATGFRDRVGLLDGGIDAWRDAGGPVTAETGTPPRRGSVRLRLAPETFVDRAWVRAHLDDPRVQFLDARMRAGFDRARLPHAMSVSAFELLTPGRTRESWSLPPDDSLQRKLAESGVSPTKDAVAYCAIGESATVVYFALRSLGRTPRLYDGSMEDWGREAGLPVERGAKAPR